jgi:hypothetical protein
MYIYDSFLFIPRPSRFSSTRDPTFFTTSVAIFYRWICCNTFTIVSKQTRFTVNVVTAKYADGTLFHFDVFRESEQTASMTLRLTYVVSTFSTGGTGQQPLMKQKEISEGMKVPETHM